MDSAIRIRKIPNPMLNFLLIERSFIILCFSLFSEFATGFNIFLFLSFVVLCTRQSKQIHINAKTPFQKRRSSDLFTVKYIIVIINSIIVTIPIINIYQTIDKSQWDGKINFYYLHNFFYHFNLPRSQMFELLDKLFCAINCEHTCRRVDKRDVI